MKELSRIPPGTTLGLNYTCMHDSSVALVGPSGEPLFACALERVTRTKQDGRWPAEILDQMPWDRIDRISIGSLNLEDSARLGEAFANRDWPARRKREREDLTPFPYPSQWTELISSLPGERLHFDHHQSHAASAYYSSGFDQALVFTCDAGAYQCPWNFAVYRGDGDALELIAGAHFLEFMTPAHLYTLVTALLGHRPNRHEGKVTGLSARGLVTAEDVAVFEEMAWPMAEDLGKLVVWDMCADLEHAPTCVVNEATRQAWRGEFSRFSDEQLAACAQRVLESYVLAMVEHGAEIAGGSAQNVCLAGGVFANVLLNQKVLSRFERGFVAPAMTDDGIALGAAFLGHLEKRPAESPRRHRSTMYLGPDTGHPAQALEDLGLAYERPERLAVCVAEALAEGRIVAVARGRMEFGPRALGHRSVLAPATDASINDWLNKKLQRTEFMPFAPMMLPEDAEEQLRDWRGQEGALRYMTVTVDCAAEMSSLCPAVVHIDGSARPQVVSPEDDPFTAEVLAEYRRLSGRPALVNTSFNVHEEPITCSAENALVGFAQTGLDHLCLDEFFVSRQGNEAILDQLAANQPKRVDRPGNLRTPIALGRWIDRLGTHNAILSAQERHWRVTQEQTELAKQEAEREKQEAQQSVAGLRSELHAMVGMREEMDRTITTLKADLQGIKGKLDGVESRWWVRVGRKFRIM